MTRLLGGDHPAIHAPFGYHPFEYHVPHTETVLELRFGPYLDARLLGTLLSVVQGEVLELYFKHGPDTTLSTNGYEYVTGDRVEFSVYSPLELPWEWRLTWRVVKTVVDGLVDLLIIQKKHREVSFRITDGPNRQFVGYGHIFQDRVPVQSKSGLVP